MNAASSSNLVEVSLTRDSQFDIGGKNGNIVTNSSHASVLKGFRILTIDGKPIGGTEKEAAEALFAARRRGKFKAQFAGFKPAGGGGVMSFAAVGTAVVAAKLLRQDAADKAAADKAAAAADKAAADKRAADKAAADKAEKDKVAADKAAADKAAVAEAAAAAKAAAAAEAAAAKAATAKAAAARQQQLVAAWEAAGDAPAPRPGAFASLPARASVAEPQVTLLASLSTWQPPPAEEEEEEANEAPEGPCDKCDGKHATSKCPHFKDGRDKHADAWHGYSGEGGEGGKSSGASKAAAPPPTLRGAKVIRQPGDGSCLFHSLAYGMRGTRRNACGSADEVRESVAGFIEKMPHAEIGGSPIRDWIQWESGSGVAAYCARMRGQGEWGGAIELAVVSRLFGVSVHVFEREGGAGGGFRLISMFDAAASGGMKAAEPVRVLYSGRCHYDALEA